MPEEFKRRSGLVNIRTELNSFAYSILPALFSSLIGFKDIAYTNLPSKHKYRIKNVWKMKRPSLLACIEANGLINVSPFLGPVEVYLNVILKILQAFHFINSTTLSDRVPISFNRKEVCQTFDPITA
ncbi:unnamed protein product [Orchesella dallaii]|uniref:Uncharacterized protein n=1 Tax=Orchesella dallaii TaxID=48710 RepID=A0ABP1S0L3_9HEXA